MAKTILVLFGGVSTEYIVSLRSAFNIIGGLRQGGFRVIRVGIAPNGDWLRFDGDDEAILHDTWQDQARASLKSNITGGASLKNNITGGASSVCSPRDFIINLCGVVPDCVFPALHGINCEDGSLQGLLTLAGFPYVGCGVLASAAGMDKLHAKMIFRYACIPQARFFALSREEIERDPATAAAKAARAIGLPCFVKPSNGGSSVGTSRADTEGSLVDALTGAAVYDRTVIVEELIKGREIEVAILGNNRPKAGAIGEVATTDEVAYYDYQAKYFMDNGARIIVPASLDEKTASRIRHYAVKAYKMMGCAGMARVDFFYDDEEGRILINEINTLPGFTPISIYPKSFEVSGMPLPKLVGALCRLAISQHQASRRKENV